MFLYQPDIVGTKVVKDVDNYSDLIKYIQTNNSKESSKSNSFGYGLVNNENKK